MTVHKINVDMNVKCEECGKPGATGTGDSKGRICMECMNKHLKAELKKDRISRDILQEIATDLEKLLLEKQEQIEWAFKKVPDGFKISIGINLDHTIPPTAEYSVSFPLEPAHEPVLKEKVTLKKVIGQTELDV